MRCRLNLSSWGKSWEGFGCSPIKRIRELGLVRRESVRSLSSEGKTVEISIPLRTKGSDGNSPIVY